MYYTREEINTILAGIQEGKTYKQVMDEMYPKSELQCLYECADCV